MQPNLINKRFKSFQRSSHWYNGFDLSFWTKQNVFIFRSQSNFYISLNHIDLITKYFKWNLKKSGIPQFLLPVDFPITKKPTEVRMGKGKGAIQTWALPLKKGSHFFFF